MKRLGAGDSKATAKRVPFHRMLRFASYTELALNSVGCVAAVAAGTAQPLLGLFIGNLAQSVINLRGDASLSLDFLSVTARDASYIALTGIAVMLCTWLFMTIWGYTGEMNTNRIRIAYFDAILHQDITWFEGVGAGEITTRIQTDTHLVQQGISEKVPLVIQHCSAFVTGFVIAFVRSWRITLALIFMLPVVSITSIVMSKQVSKYAGTALQTTSEASSIVEEVVSDIRTAKAYGSTVHLVKLYVQRISSVFKAERRAALWHGVGHSSFYLTIYAAYAVSVFYGTILVLHGLADISSIVTVMVCVMYGSFSIAYLAPEVNAINTARIAALKIYATIDSRSVCTKHDFIGSEKSFPSLNGNIVFENVSFSYPSRPGVPIFKNTSLVFQANKTTAIVGRSGSGKSTIINLIERFYKPDSGMILLNGHDISTLDPKWLRCNIGYVAQESVLFSTTIRENILMGLIGRGSEVLSEEQINLKLHQASVNSYAHSFISELPRGYDTLVGENGTQLSGGQRQRIALARALISDPPILILDEATSALDSESERVVQKALAKASSGRTTIMVAHRLSTVENADNIFVMEKGVIVEEGTHQQLLAQKGHYASCVMYDTRTGSLDSLSNSSELTESSSTEKQPLHDVNKIDNFPSEDHYEKKRWLGPWYLLKRLTNLEKGLQKDYLIAVAFAISCIYPSFGILYARTITTFEDTISQHSFKHFSEMNALYLLVLALVACVSVGLQNFLFGRAGARLTALVREHAFSATLKQDVEYFDDYNHSTGSLVHSLSDSPRKISALAGITAGAILQSSITILVGPLIGLAFHWKLALVGVATMPLVVSTGYIRLRVVVLKDRSNKKAHEESARLACEGVSSARTVVALAAEDLYIHKYTQSLMASLHRSIRSSFIANAIFASSASMQFYVLSLIYYYGTRLRFKEEISTLEFFVCLYSVTYAAIQAANVFAFVRDISSAKTAAEDLVRLLDSIPGTVTPPDSSQHALLMEPLKTSIMVQNVHFAYPSRPDSLVLHGLNLEVCAGEKVAIVGSSGCGKSTVLQLLLRFYNPSSGTILFNGQNVSESNPEAHRTRISFVSQEPKLYAGSIGFNIALGVGPSREPTSVSVEELEKACAEANILDFVNSLPERFETDVGSKGIQLSGGQKQRIALARALIRQPAILLLDEATSALDTHSEQTVQRALDCAPEGRTTIVIAHRLSSVKNCDKIHYMQRGTIVESGSHRVLMEKQGSYWRLWNAGAFS